MKGIRYYWRAWMLVAFSLFYWDAYSTTIIVQTVNEVVRQADLIVEARVVSVDFLFDVPTCGLILERS